MDECVFCQIIQKKIEASIVYEDSDFIAFLDKSPIFKGHTLLVPKNHMETVFDIDDRTLGELSIKAKFIASGVKTALNADGILFINNNVVSQSVPHFHLHIIPRRKGEVLKGFMWPRHRYTGREEEEYKKKIIDVLQTFK